MKISTLSEAKRESFAKEQPAVTIAVISYNGLNVLQLCLDSILAQTYKNVEICLVNNASTDGTQAWVKKQYPDVKVLNCSENRGPNPARNLAIKLSQNSLVMLVDDDAVLERDCLAELMEAFHQYSDAAVWSPRIVYHDRKDLIQFEGTSIYYLAEAILLNSDTSIQNGLKEITPVQVAGGVCYLLSKKAASAIGMFDEDYFFGRTDGEFTFRLTQAGYSIYSVPKAVCYHRVKRRGLSKVFYQVRNRWYLILQTYAWKTIILIFPALIVYEISLFTFLLLKGSTKEYLLALASVIKNLPSLLKKRAYVQRLRKLPDKAILHSGLINIRKDLVQNPLILFLKAKLNAVLNIYWKVVYPLL